MTKDKVAQSRISRIEPLASDVSKKRKKKFITPELKRLGTLQEAKGQFFGTFDPIDPD